MCIEMVYSTVLADLPECRTISDRMNTDHKSKKHFARENLCLVANMELSSSSSKTHFIQPCGANI